MRPQGGEVTLAGGTVRWSLGSDARHASAVWARFKSSSLASEMAKGAKDYQAAADIILEGMRTLCMDCVVGVTVDELEDLGDDAIETVAGAIIAKATGGETEMGKAPATSGASQGATGRTA